MYKNINKYKIKYTDADVYDNLKPSSLLSFLEESACLSADELGFGYSVITPKNLGFIIVNYHIELFRAIKLGEELEVHTWPLKPRHLIFLRDFELYIDGVKVGAATTRWCMINTQNYTMAPVSAFFKEGDFDNYNTCRSIGDVNWKIPAVADKFICGKSVSYSDYDHYFHVNNTKYADLLMDTFTLDELKDKYISVLQVNYVKQCKLGEKIDMYRAESNGFYYVDGKVGDELRVRFGVKLNEV